MEDLSWSLWPVYVKLWLNGYFDLVDRRHSFMTGLKSYNKTPWPHLYTAVHANRKVICLLSVVFCSIKLTYVYVYSEHHQLTTAESYEKKNLTSFQLLHNNSSIGFQCKIRNASQKQTGCNFSEKLMLLHFLSVCYLEIHVHVSCQCS